MTIEAMKQALDALENYTAIKHPQQRDYRDSAIDALRAAIEQAEKKEPVAYMNQNSVIHPADYEWARVDKDLVVTHLDMELCRKGPQNAYTALALAIWDAAKKDWQGLTDEEIINVLHPLVMADLSDEATDYEIARAIETKLKEKNT